MDNFVNLTYAMLSQINNANYYKLRTQLNLNLKLIIFLRSTLCKLIKFLLNIFDAKRFTSIHIYALSNLIVTIIIINTKKRTNYKKYTLHLKINYFFC